MKVTFVHLENKSGKGPSIALLPVGLPALAAIIDDKGFEAEIVHVGIEKILSEDFDIVDYLKKKELHVICFDMHWHYQITNVIDTAKRVKKAIPDCKIIIGGFTASRFADEILKEHSQIDFVIRGDAEVPLTRLCEYLRDGKEGYDEIPNLAWRKKKQVILNALTYTVTEKIINKLEFCRFEMVRNYKAYADKYLRKGQCFYYLCGRGCSVNCSFCGGALSAQRKLNNRNRPIFIEHTAAVREIKHAVDHGQRIWSTSFDPYPNKDYYLKLFEMIRTEHLNMGLNFESWSIPNRGFIDSFAKTFDIYKSEIVISPESGSENVRRKNKGFFYTNDQLLDAVKYCESKSIVLRIFFTVGLPFERISDTEKTRELMKQLKKHQNVILDIEPIDMEPASPWSEHCKTFCTISQNKSLGDYYKAHKAGYELGYETNYMSHKEIMVTYHQLKSEIDNKLTQRNTSSDKTGLQMPPTKQRISKGIASGKRVDLKTGFLCNNNCVFCVQADNKCTGNRKLEEIKADLVESSGRCDSVVLTGGEVTIRKDFLDIVRLAKQIGYKSIQIQSNGRMFSNINLCRKTMQAGSKEFGISIHGHCALQHDKLTRAKGSFDQTLRGIKNLISLGAIVAINVVVVTSNYKDSEKIAQLLVNSGVKQFQFAFVHPVGNAWDNYDSVVPLISKAAPYIQKALQIGIDAGIIVMAEAVPPCLMHGYESYISDRFIPESEIKGKKHQNIKDFSKWRKDKGKVKFKQCIQCVLNNSCEGPWKEYPMKKGDSEFKPIVRREGKL